MNRVTVPVSAVLLSELLTEGEVWPKVRCTAGLPEDAKFIFSYFRGDVIYLVFESWKAAGEIVAQFERIDDHVES